MPASYPTTPKTFTTKEAGQTFSASFVTALQDEVEAISSGLLAGTARLNSSNSTLATLSVPGVSTLASLQVSSNATIGSTLSGGSIQSTSIACRQSFVRVRTSTQYQYSTTLTYGTITFDSKVVDVSSEWNAATYSFTPVSSGTYLIACHTYSYGNNGWQILRTVLNGVSAICWHERYDTSAGAAELGLQNVCVRNLDAGDTITFSYLHAVGNTGRLYYGALTEAAIVRLR